MRNTIVIVLICLLGMTIAAGTTHAQRSYAGFYSGSLSTGGHVALYASRNDEVNVVVIDPDSGSFGANTSIKIKANGDFNGTYSIATIAGQITQDGALTGSVSPLGITFSATRSPDIGVTQNFAGLYQGWVFDPDHRLLSATVMISHHGVFLLYIQNGTSVTDAGYGTIDERGIFAFTDANKVSSSGSVITAAAGNGLNGRYTKPGVGAFTFVVARRTAANKLINIATRAKVAGGNEALIAGFVIEGGAKTVLIRGVGPTLANYGITSGLLADPTIDLYSGLNVIASNNDWSTNANATELRDATARIGGFPLPANSKDAALLVRLEPGNYTAHLSGADGGIGLIEVYEIP